MQKRLDEDGYTKRHVKDEFMCDYKQKFSETHTYIGVDYVVRQC